MDDNKDANYTYNKKILESSQSLLKHYTNKHNKTLVVRCDIRYPKDYDKPTETNEDISKCMRKVRKKYFRQGYDINYLWVREQDSSHHPHYHVAMLFNGNKMRSYTHVFKTVETMFKNTIGVNNDGLVDKCMTSKNGNQHENGILLDRNKENYPQRLQDVYRQLSYFAKSYSKGEYKDGLRDFGMSRL